MNHIERAEMFQQIQKKLRAHEALTDEEIQEVCSAVEDPLGEFCLREGVFRLIEILNVNPEVAEKHVWESAEIIRDIIDYSEYIYDDMDSKLRDYMLEHGIEGGE